MLSRLLNQAWRGLLRIFPFSSPDTMSQVHFTSRAVNGLPSCHFTPLRNVKVSSVMASFHFQWEASSGTMEARLFCGTCWSYMTRLLNSGMKGMTTDAV